MNDKLKRHNLRKIKKHPLSINTTLRRFKTFVKLFIYKILLIKPLNRAGQSQHPSQQQQQQPMDLPKASVRQDLDDLQNCD